MASIFRKRGRWWARLKNVKGDGRWTSKPTPFKIGKPEDEQSALRVAADAQAKIDERAAAGKPQPMTVAVYAEGWLVERATLDIRSYRDDVGRIRNHVLPIIGSLVLTEVRPRHIRDMIRTLKKKPDLAPRTILNINGIARTLFRDAFVDELIVASPYVTKHGDLPEKSDKDPEWRELTMYAMSEVISLISDPRLPVERRVQYALKSLAGLRHGEVAGARWRNYAPELEPLGKLSIARSYKHKRTKTDVTRPVPVHPLLAQILAAWRADHWPRIYGRAPTEDDLIVPTRTLEPVQASEAVSAFHDDLGLLGLRIEAGEHRKRGGHDLRSWFISTAMSHGAPVEVLVRVTHTKRKDVISGYTRLPWETVCGAVAKLRITVDGDPLSVAPELADRELSAHRRWSKMATPTGFEPVLPA